MQSPSDMFEPCAGIEINPMKGYQPVLKF